LFTAAGDLKSKWKNIRDNYTRFINEKRKTKSGSEAKSSKTYIWRCTIFSDTCGKKTKVSKNLKYIIKE